MNFIRRLFPQKTKRSVGQIGEDAACVFLKKKGYKILDRNYKNTVGKQLGEIDIVAREGETVVFVEVKTRVGLPEDTSPQENITRGKMQRVERIANAYLREKRLLNVPHRFDAVCVWCDHTSKNVVSIQHIESIFF